MNAEQLIERITALIDMQRLCSKGRVEIPLDLIPLKADEAEDILPELLLMRLPFTIRLVAGRKQYYLRITSEVFPKETGYFVYRYFINGEEVYIGRTNRPAKRFLEHCRDDGRYRNVTRIDIHKCSSKADMIFLERILICRERPLWNISDMDNGELSYELPPIKYKSYTQFEVFQRYM